MGLAQGEATDYYYNESWQVVEERKDGAGDAHTEYVWDLRYIDAPVVRWQDANGDGDTSDTNETLYYTGDANMNVTAVVDTSGNVVERYMYDAYGNVTVLDADWSSDADGDSDVSNEILYGGYRYDTETGLYHVRRRMYHPTLGRWMTRDPIEYADGTALYAYTRSSPAVRTDPGGLMSEAARKKRCDEIRALLPAVANMVAYGDQNTMKGASARENYARAGLATGLKADRRMPIDTFNAQRRPRDVKGYSLKDALAATKLHYDLLKYQPATHTTPFNIHVSRSAGAHDFNPDFGTRNNDIYPYAIRPDHSIDWYRTEGVQGRWPSPAASTGAGLSGSRYIARMVVHEWIHHREALQVQRFFPHLKGAKLNHNPSGPDPRWDALEEAVWDHYFDESAINDWFNTPPVSQLGNLAGEYESLCCKPPLSPVAKQRLHDLGAEF